VDDDGSIETVIDGVLITISARLEGATRTFLKAGTAEDTKPATASALRRAWP
jgi:hypothetical protein